MKASIKAMLSSHAVFFSFHFLDYTNKTEDCELLGVKVQNSQKQSLSSMLANLPNDGNTPLAQTSPVSSGILPCAKKGFCEFVNKLVKVVYNLSMEQLGKEDLKQYDSTKCADITIPFLTSVFYISQTHCFNFHSVKYY